MSSRQEKHCIYLAIATVNEIHTRDVTSSITEDASMESEHHSSVLSQSHTNDDDDIVEIESGKLCFVLYFR